MTGNMWMLVCYLVGAVLCYGVFFAFWQKTFTEGAEDRYSADFLVSLKDAVVWPYTLFAYATVFASRRRYRFQGFKFY